MQVLLQIVYLFDLFPQNVGFRVSRENDTLRSVFGTILSIPILIVTGIYTYNRYTILVQHKATNISVLNVPNA